MGNRATINFDNGISVYLHWNGGPESVEAFVDACRELGIRDDDYGPARFCQVVGNFFGGNMSLGIGTFNQIDGMADGDNGAYRVKGWKITSRDNTYDWRSSRDLVKHYEGVKHTVLQLNRPFFNLDYKRDTFLQIAESYTKAACANELQEKASES